MDVAASHPSKRHVLHQIENVSFSFYKSSDIRKISVRQITYPVAFDSLQRPVAGGLYDPALGVLDRSVTKLCATCHLGYAECPGHFGHIELALPVVHPVLFPLLVKVLRSKCWYCHRFRLGSRAKKLFVAKLRFLYCNQWKKAEQVGEIIKVLNTQEEQRKQQKSFSSSSHYHPSSSATSVVDDDEEQQQISKSAAVSFSSIDARIESRIKAKEDELCEQARELWVKATASYRTCPISQQHYFEDSPQGASLRKKTTEEFLSASDTLGKCQNCGQPSVAIRREDSKIFRVLRKSQNPKQLAATQGKKEEDESDQETNSSMSSNKILLSTIEMEQQVSLLYPMEKECVQVLWELDWKEEENIESIFFIRCLAVTPCRYRPPATFGDSDQVMEHPQNVFYTRILQINQQLIEWKEQQQQQPQENVSSSIFPIQQMLILQFVVSDLYDCSRGGSQTSQGTVSGTGIRQQLEHKEGLFRMHMMGKRVNHSARSVISPDPFLETCEVGVPESFAMKLVFPEPVTCLNIEYLRSAILRGCTEYPGANGMEDRMGNVIDFMRAPEHQRKAQALSLNAPNSFDSCDSHGGGGGKREDATFRKSDNSIIRVYRHMKNGDLILFNRQPSLHRVSILAHKVRILPGERTIRMHYANCQSYNADFDGDEMNLHFPQDYVAQSEAANLLLTDRHYISPTNGNPLRGLIQDHILGGVLLTSIDTFLRLDEFQQLLYGAIERTMEGMMKDHNYDKKKNHNIITNNPIFIPTPAILLPVPLWTGKQLISTILLFLIGSRPPFNLQSQNKLKSVSIHKY